ncbi:hypothetical protein [Methylobacterium sp. PvR107]|uniref:hypothetical protein n=1 Tax=Methylobacterium sp. PvR107 TaxID=2806597 RepID=UPI001AE358B6|nr:hypothetical protein [Methylobacterium sp. PvR107]MBP1179285.1 calcineurin-like phosphoesterase family protein [Methylobacterium sp. PvR107]
MKNRIFTPSGPVLFNADDHLNHGGGIRMCRRPFASVEEMNAFLIEAWNATVRPKETVFRLGDFAMGASPEQCAEFFGRCGAKSTC